MRLAILLAVLAFVALGAWLDRTRSRDWDDTLRVTVYPIATADGTGAVRAYVGALQAGAFADVESFLQRARRSRTALRSRSPSRFASRTRRRSATRVAGPPGPPTIGCGACDCVTSPPGWRGTIRCPRPTSRCSRSIHAGADATAVPDSVGLSKGLIAVDPPLRRRRCGRQQPGGRSSTRCCTRSARPTSTTWRPASRSRLRGSANRIVDPLYPQRLRRNHGRPHRDQRARRRHRR